MNFQYVVKNVFLMVDFRSRLTDFEFPASNLTKRLEKHENRHFAIFKTKFSLFIMNNDTENVNFGNIPSQTQIRILPQMSFKTDKKYKNNVNINCVHKCGAKLVINQNLTKKIEISWTSTRSARCRRKSRHVCFERCY